MNDLGRGAMATVYRAADENDGRIVALKVLSLAEDWPEDRRAEARLRLLREAELWSASAGDGDPHGLDERWQGVRTQQFHTSIPGSAFP